MRLDRFWKRLFGRRTPEPIPASGPTPLQVGHALAAALTRAGLRHVRPAGDALALPGFSVRGETWAVHPAPEGIGLTLRFDLRLGGDRLIDHVTGGGADVRAALTDAVRQLVLGSLPPVRVAAGEPGGTPVPLVRFDVPRQALLGPILGWGGAPTPTGLALLEAIGPDLELLLAGPGRQLLTLAAGRDGEGRLDAEIRIDGDSVEDGREGLIALVAQWPGTAAGRWAQRLVLLPAPRDRDET